MHPLHTIACWLTIVAVVRLPLTTSVDSLSDYTPPSLSKLANEYHENHKKTTVEYPDDALLRNFEKICSEAHNYYYMHMEMLEVGPMRIKLMTSTSNFTVHLKEASLLWQSPKFDFSYSTVVLVAGWHTADDRTTPVTDMYKAYKCRGNWNFVFLDTDEYQDTTYAGAALNTEEIGKTLGSALNRLPEDYSTHRVHLIGHSLGAHIVGAAGRAFKKITGKQLNRITGLDPAIPCFKMDLNRFGLSRTDAKFVDIIHTNLGGLGIREAVGHVDFYANGADEALQPGCADILCSHMRAYQYYAESVYPINTYGLQAIQCTSWADLDDYRCRPIVRDVMGYATPATIRDIDIPFPMATFHRTRMSLVALRRWFLIIAIKAHLGIFNL